MKIKISFNALIVFTLLISVSCNKIPGFKKKEVPPPVGYGFKNQAITTAKGEISDFALLDHNGVFQQLYRHSDAKAVVIISQGNDCPIIQKYGKTINEIKKKFENQNVVFYLMNSNLGDNRQALIDEAKKYGYELPILMDPSQIIAELLGITRTAEAVVINPQGWKIIYRGAISDRLDYGADKQAARNNYLSDFLDSHLAGKVSNVTPAPAKGCLTSFQKPDLSYEKSVAPIISAKCLNCHSEAGGYLPHFNSYDKMKNWVAMSKETLYTDRMPPFSADTHYGKFRNDISLSPEEKRTLVKWFEAGAPKDGTTDPLTAKSVQNKFTEKKMAMKNSEPIYTVTMEPKKIPPGGEIEYQYIQLGGPAPFDMWIHGGWTTSTNPRQIHHASLMVTSKPLKFYEKLARKKYKIDEEEIEQNTDGDVFLYVLNALNKYERKNASDNYLRIMVWGAGKPQPFSFRKRGVAFFPKGSYLILETHYMGTGTEETEATTIKFYGTREKPKKLKALRSYTLYNSTMEVPPMVKDFEVVTPEWVIPRDIHLNNFLGHLHMRGKSAKLDLIRKNGEVKTIVSIPNYYYGWQTGSGLEPIEPIAVKAGEKLRASCRFDNSPQNPFNPDPTKNVKWGQRVDRTEMCKMNLNYTID